MRTLVLLLISVCYISSYSQNKADIGFVVGGTQYYGDLNSNNIISSPTLAHGYFYRYNLNHRTSFRLSAINATVSSASIWDLSLVAEFNFLKINPKDKYERGAVFLFGGVGYAAGGGLGDEVLLSDAPDGGSIKMPPITIPIGVGYRYYITERVGLGAEISIRKTFTDVIDNKDSSTGALGNNTLANNNDLYTFAGISITYKFFNFAASCPVYD